MILNDPRRSHVEYVRKIPIITEATRYNVEIMARNAIMLETPPTLRQ